MKGSARLPLSKGLVSLKFGLIAAFILLVAFPSASWAQRADRAIITGLVSDPAGASVPDATVTIINEGTNEKTVVASSSDGNYSTPPLILGTYTVQVEKTGFKTFVRRSILLTGGANYRQDATLELGAVTQTVEVKGTTEMINVQTPEVSHVVGQKYYQDLPVVMGTDVRLAESQLVMQPGYLPMLPNGDPMFRGSQFNSRINGGMVFATENYLDGASFGSAWDHNQTHERQPPYEAIQEMHVIDSTFSAQYGRTSGGFIEYVTKSGTAELHGNAYEYNNVSALNARGELVPSVGHRVLNASGFSLGGPIVIPKVYNGKGKTYFFTALDLTELRQGVLPSYVLSVATPQDKAGDFSARLGATPTQVGTDALGRPIYSGEIFNPSTTRQVNGIPVRDGYGFDPTTGLPTATANMIPANDPLLSGIAAKINTYLPNPDRAGLTDNGFNPSGNAWLNPKTWLTRIDHQIKPNFKETTTVNYTRRASLRECSGYNGGCSEPTGAANYFGQGFYQNIQTRTVHQQFEWVIKPNLFNHTTVSFDRWIMPNIPEVKPGGWLARLGIKGLPDDTGGTPRVNYSDVNVPYQTIGNPDGPMGGIEIANRWQFLDDLTWIKGKHTIKMGFEWRHNMLEEAGKSNISGSWNFSQNETAAYNSNGVINLGSGDAFASYMLGQVDNANFSISNPSSWGEAYVSPWVNDEIKVTKKLTLQIGLRWDYQTAMWEKYNRDSQFSYTLPDPDAGGVPGAMIFGGKGPGRNGYVGGFETPNHDAWGPRFGFAYALSGKTSVRGGYGIYYAGLTKGISGDPNMGFVNSPTVSNFTGGLQPVFWWDKGFPQSAIQYPPITDPGIADGTTPMWVNPNAKTLPRYQNFSFAVEHQLDPNTMVSVTFIGNHATRLEMGGSGDFVGQYYGNMNNPSILTYGASLLESDINSPAAVTAGIKKPYSTFTGDVAQAIRPFPQYTGIAWMNNPIGTSHYDAVQLKLERRFARGAMVRLAYVNSKFINNGADSGWGGDDGIQNPLLGTKGARSLDYDDVPQTLILAYSVELPFGPGKRFANTGGFVGKLVGGWKFSGVQRYDEGRPMGITMPNDMGGFLFNNSKYPNRLPGSSCQWSGGHFDPNVNTWMNSSCWADPGPLTFGNGGREDAHVRGPHVFNEDWNLFKDTKITERVTHRFEAQFGNVFNRHFWCYPSSTWGVSTFGVISGQCNEPRQIQFGMKINF
jgi:hypothetical protein